MTCVVAGRSSKNDATFLPRLPNPPKLTSSIPARHGLRRSSGESKFASMNEFISTRYSCSSQSQNRPNASASLVFENCRISSVIASRPWRTNNVEPSAYTARYIGSTGLILTKSSMSAPAALNASARRFGMVSTVGPLSSRKPSEISIPARPPGIASRSTIVMSWPRFERWAAADRPPKSCADHDDADQTLSGAHVVSEVDERELRLIGEVGTIDRVDRRGSERRDVFLEFVEGAGVDDDLLDLLDLRRSEGRIADEIEHARARCRRGRPCGRAAVSACPRAGRRRPACRSRGVAERTEHVVAELERLAER